MLQQSSSNWSSSHRYHERIKTSISLLIVIMIGLGVGFLVNIFQSTYSRYGSLDFSEVGHRLEELSILPQSQGMKVLVIALSSGVLAAVLALFILSLASLWRKSRAKNRVGLRPLGALKGKEEAYIEPIIGLGEAELAEKQSEEDLGRNLDEDGEKLGGSQNSEELDNGETEPPETAPEHPEKRIQSSRAAVESASFEYKEESSQAAEPSRKEDMRKTFNGLANALEILERRHSQSVYLQWILGASYALLVSLAPILLGGLNVAVLGLFILSSLLLLCGLLAIIGLQHRQSLEHSYQNALQLLYQGNSVGQRSAINELCALVIFAPQTYQRQVLRHFLGILGQTQESWYQHRYASKPSVLVQSILRVLVSSIKLDSLQRLDGLYSNVMQWLYRRKFELAKGEAVNLFNQEKSLKLSNLYLVGADFSGLRLAEVSVHNCQLSQSLWAYSVISDFSILDSQLDQADLRNSEWRRAYFQNALMRELLVERTFMLQVNIEGCNIQGLRNHADAPLAMEHCLIQDSDLRRSQLFLHKWTSVRLVSTLLMGVLMLPDPAPSTVSFKDCTR